MKFLIVKSSPIPILIPLVPKYSPHTENTIKKINANFEGRIFHGTHRNRWEDTVRKDANHLLGIRNSGLKADR